MELTSIVSAIYLASYVLPPMLYDCRNFWNHFFDQVKGIIAYFLTIPMYQIVFQLFAYANLHDVSWGNRDAAAIG
jgi:cellulose synthase/poly-beta-1,6-N-acetylglucosamine synthase-like glycosyltransferase